jgi:glycosyltransferase involved in cell wall biosynthesis
VTILAPLPLLQPVDTIVQRDEEASVRIVLDGRYIQDHFPGIARYTFNLALALGSAGLDEVIVLVDPSAPNRRFDLARLRSAGGVRIQPIAAPVFGIAGLAQLTSALRMLRPDVYHAPYFLRSPFYSGPSVVTIFDLIAEHASANSASGTLPKLRRALFHLATELAILTSSRVIVPSRSTAIDLAARHPGARAKARLVPLGVDPIFRPSDPKAIASVRDRYGLPESFLLVVGINKPHKNLSGLVRVLRRPELAGVRLVWAGPVDRRYPGALDLARDRGVAGQVSQLGEVPDADLPALYSAAAVFVCPSLDEGFGLTPLEAMSCGTPVVVASSSSLPEVVGDAGVLFDPGDEIQLAGAIRGILDGPDLAARQRAAGLRQAARFSWAEVARATTAIYREVAPTR